MNSSLFPLKKRLAHFVLMGLGALALLAAPTARAAAKVGVLLKGSTAFWGAVEQGCRDVAQKNGTELVVRKPASESDIAGQIKLLDEIVREGVTALIIAPCSSRTTTINAANTSPRSNHLLMRAQRSE